jgi:hypothetical protein
MIDQLTQGGGETLRAEIQKLINIGVEQFVSQVGRRVVALAGAKP